MLRKIARAGAVLCAFVLAACGGGGSAAPAGAALTLNPSKLTASAPQGRSSAMTVIATVNDPASINGPLYVLIVDSQRVLTGEVSLTQIDERRFQATVFTSPALPMGPHIGTFQVTLCKDINCSAQYPGSPVSLPYEVTVTNGPLQVSRATTTATGGDPAAAPSVVLTPSPLVANVQEGAPATLTVQARAPSLAPFTGPVFVHIDDPQKVLQGAINVSSIDDSTFATTLFTSATLPVQRHQGALKMLLCKDLACAQQYPGSPVALSYDLNVTAKPLVVTPAQSTTASVYWGAALNQTVTVNVGGPSTTWTASTAANWLQVSSGAGQGPGAFAVSFAAQGLAVGKYTAPVTVRSSDGQSFDVSFTLDVLPAQFVFTGINTTQFFAINGAPIDPRTVEFQLNSNVASPWTATTTAPWLLADPNAGTTPGRLTLQPDPSRGPLASGDYTANLVLSSPGIDNAVYSTWLRLTRPSLSGGVAAVTLGGPKGRDLVTPQSLPFALNTGSNRWPWAVSGMPAWLSTSTPSGTVGQTGAALSLAPNAATATPGSFSATLQINANINGDSASLPVTVNLNLDQRRLLVSEWGVAFASTPSGTTLNRSLTVRDNFEGKLPWTASADRAWLNVTASGTTAGDLVLSADASALPNGAMSYANVTVRSSTAGVEPAVVRVGVWKDSTGLSSIVKLPIDYSHVVADKIRPYVYAHNGGSVIDVFNAYTAQKIGSVSDAVATAGGMAVSPDGSRLYVTSALGLPSVAVIDLATLTRTATWALSHPTTNGTSLLAIRPNGVEVLVFSDGYAYSQGRSLGATGIFGSLTASADGRKLYMQDQGFSPASVSAYDVDYSAMSGGLVMIRRVAAASFINNAGNGRDIAVAHDGSRLVTASGAPYLCSSVDPINLGFLGSLPGGDAYPNNAEVTIDGRMICGISGWYATSDFWVHSSTGALLSSFRVSGYAKALKDSQMVVTPDGIVVVALTDDPLMAFVPIGR
jgi:Viral BACON domain